MLYNSIFRADDDMLVNPQVHGIAAVYAPVLHLHRVEQGGMFATSLVGTLRAYTRSENAEGP